MLITTADPTAGRAFSHKLVGRSPFRQVNGGEGKDGGFLATEGLAGAS